MPTLTCSGDCEDYKVGMPQIEDAFIMVYQHWGIKYTGKPFRECPWCGRDLKIEEKNNES